MTDEDASAYLASFLEFGRLRCIEILEASTHFTAEIDFSLESIPPAFADLLDVLGTVPKAVDPTLPEFIRHSETYEQNLFEFDEQSKPIVLAAAYYLGEAFVRQYHELSWATGARKFHQCNMPVIKGFVSNLELPPILVTENLFGAVFSGADEISSIDSTIESWIGFVPA